MKRISGLGSALGLLSRGGAGRPGEARGGPRRPGEARGGPRRRPDGRSAKDKMEISANCVSGLTQKVRMMIGDGTERKRRKRVRK